MTVTDSNLPHGRDSLTEDLRWRGLIQDSTGLDELRELLDGGSATFYVGFDPTAPSLHVGHLMQVTTARRLQLAGHRPLLLVGGATGQIGDPKESAERTLNPPEVVEGWVRRIHDQLAPFVSYTGEHAAQLVNNLDWTGEMSVVEFLRDVGKHFPVNKMLAREVVKARLDTGISFTEFSYQLLQANDFFELHRRHGCQLQYGGSDQWGNITAGVDYVRRRGAGPVQAFVTPLVTKADGTKFGKTEGGAVWLDPEMTSPYAFYQFWVNADDRDVTRYLRYFSFRSREELEELEKATAERPQARLAQRALAEEAHHAGARGAGDGPGGHRQPGALRSGVPRRAVPGDAAGRAHRGRPGAPHGAAGRGGPAQGVRAGAEHEGGPAGDRRGWRLRQQHPDLRGGRHRRPGGPAARSVPGAAPRQALVRRR